MEYTSQIKFIGIFVAGIFLIVSSVGRIFYVSSSIKEFGIFSLGCLLVVFAAHNLERLIIIGISSVSIILLRELFRHNLPNNTITKAFESVLVSVLAGSVSRLFFGGDLSIDIVISVSFGAVSFALASRS